MYNHRTCNCHNCLDKCIELVWVDRALMTLNMPRFHVILAINWRIRVHRIKYCLRVKIRFLLHLWYRKFDRVSAKVTKQLQVPVVDIIQVYFFLYSNLKESLFSLHVCLFACNRTKESSDLLILGHICDSSLESRIGWHQRKKDYLSGLLVWQDSTSVNIQRTLHCIWEETTHNSSW